MQIFIYLVGSKRDCAHLEKIGKARTASAQVGKVYWDIDF